MSKTNVLYRAFKDYRKNTKNNSFIRNDRKIIRNNNIDLDVLNGSKYLCHINSDWIVAIEKGLPFIDKAIQEERQFIRADGEIIPIEKVKKVSRESVEHLAKHSDMITHIPEDNDQDLIPDKLMMVEKYSDYAVYENRFLYMLLCYLNEFIYFRLSKIEELRGTYDGEMSLVKTNKTKTREYEVNILVKDRMKDNPYPIKDDETDRLIQRIKDCQQIVNSYLNRNIIVEASKAPMIKPPIVKTNVLKMNNNFKNALSLYEFISTYKGLGYTYEEVKTDLCPLKDDVADELAELVNLSLFLPYKFNNSLSVTLENDYLEEERLRAVEEERELLLKINRLKKKAMEDDKTLGEYLVLLEQRNTKLEKDSEELQVIKGEVINLNKKIDSLKKEREDLKNKIDSLKEEITQKLEEINQINQKYIKDINDLINKNEQELINAKNDYKLEVDGVRKDCENTINLKEEFVTLKLAELKRDYDEKISEYDNQQEVKIKEYTERISTLEKELESLKDEKRELINSYEIKIKTAINDANNLVSEKEKEKNEVINASKVKTEEYVNKVNKESQKIIDENELIKSQITALKIKSGLIQPGSDYTSETDFEELDKQYELFSKFVEQQWEITKKQIKNDLLSKEALKNNEKEAKRQRKEKKSRTLKK